MFSVKKIEHNYSKKIKRQVKNSIERVGKEQQRMQQYAEDE